MRGPVSSPAARERFELDPLLALHEQDRFEPSRSVRELVQDEQAVVRRLVEALAGSAGVPVIGQAVEESWRLRAAGSTPTKWSLPSSSTNRAPGMRSAR